MKLKNLNTLITGGSQGLGKVIAEHFLREGANVVICARGTKELRATRGELAQKFPTQKVSARTCDVSDEKQVSRLVAFALRELGSFQVLVLNAGIYGPMGPTESVPLDEWRRAMDINLYGVLLPCRAAIPHFKKVGRGKIIVLSGGGATNPLPNISSYAASKAAAVRLMETLAEELKDFQVDVNAIAPGALKTRFVDQVLEAGPEKVGKDFLPKTRSGRKTARCRSNSARILPFISPVRPATASPASSSAPSGIRGRNYRNSRADLSSDIYTLRRIVPKDRGKKWGDK